MNWDAIAPTIISVVFILTVGGVGVLRRGSPSSWSFTLEIAMRGSRVMFIS